MRKTPAKMGLLVSRHQSSRLFPKLGCDSWWRWKVWILLRISENQHNSGYYPHIAERFVSWSRGTITPQICESLGTFGGLVWRTTSHYRYSGFVKIVYCHALELRSGDGNHITSMSRLVNALRRRFEMTGSMTDLEEAILMHRESLREWK